MTRSFTVIFNQNDYLQTLGTSSVTIKQAGCYLTSFATLAANCGKQVNPASLNQLLIEKQLYINGNDMVDDNLTRIYPDLVYQGSLLYPTIYHADGSVNQQESKPADIAKLKELMQDPSTWVVIEVDLGHGFIHFVLCAGVNGVVSIADPESGTVIDFASKYGSPELNILKYVIYHGTPASVDSGALQGLQSQLDQVTATTKTQTETINSLQQQLQTQGTESNQKIEELTNQNNDYQKTILDLKNELADLTDQNSSLASMVKEESDKNSTAIKQGIKASSALDEFKNYFNAIASYLKLPQNQKTEKQIVEEILDEVVKLNKLKEQQLQAQAEMNKKNTQSPTSQNTSGGGGKTYNWFALLLVKLGIWV